MRGSVAGSPRRLGACHLSLRTATPPWRWVYAQFGRTCRDQRTLARLRVCQPVNRGARRAVRAAVGGVVRQADHEGDQTRAGKLGLGKDSLCLTLVCADGVQRFADLYEVLALMRGE